MLLRHDSLRTPLLKAAYKATIIGILCLSFVSCGHISGKTKSPTVSDAGKAVEAEVIDVAYGDEIISVEGPSPADLLGDQRWSKESGVQNVKKTEPQKKETVKAGVMTALRNVNLPVDSSFDSDSIALHPKLLMELDKLIKTISKEARPVISIVGHTDNTEAVENQRAVSLARAGSVRDYLVQQGVSPAKISISGVGALHPIASNASEKGRSKNRQVEIYYRE